VDFIKVCGLGAQFVAHVLVYKNVEITRIVFHIYQDELSSIKNQLVQGFSPDDAYPLGPLSFMETSRPCSPLHMIEFPSFDEVKFSKVASTLVACQSCASNFVIGFPDNDSG